ETIQRAKKVIFPGVGEARTAMNYLKNKRLDEVILNLNQPFLGICLGLELLCNKSEEGNTDCLGIFNAKVKRFPATDVVPHIGWDNFERLKGPLFSNISEDQHQYFLHSYYAEISTETTAVCEYIVPFSASMQKNNFYATQFHPEKSGEVGKKILKNFLTS